MDMGVDDGSDSDADPETGRTDTVTLSPGENACSMDAGMFLPASVGDLVWDVANGNGVQDADEQGLPGVVVRLLDPATGEAIAETTTDDAGAYAFSDLIPGDYVVDFALPEGRRFTPMDMGEDDGSDRDADPETGRTETSSPLPSIPSAAASASSSEK